MSAPLCICASIPRLTIRTAVIVLMHHREVKMPTNTGRLAHQCLVGSRLVLRGLKDEPAPPAAKAAPMDASAPLQGDLFARLSARSTLQ